MSAVYRFFRSVRLAVALLSALTFLCGLSTAVSQDQPDAYYRDRYPEWAASLILTMGFHRFFSSPLFLAPLTLFLANLGTCTVSRIMARSRIGAPHRHGPDLVHLALLLLAAGGILTAVARRERYFTLAVGDTVETSGGYRIDLLGLAEHRYPDGRPADWVSTVRVSRDGAVVLGSFAIEVNHPLRLGLLRVYQTSYGRDGSLLLSDVSGRRGALTPGQGIPLDADTVRYLVGFAETDADGKTAVFQDYRGGEPGAMYRVGLGEAMGEYRIGGMDVWDLTGLTAAFDPGLIPVLAALALGAVGLCLTFIQHARPEGP